MKKAGKRKTGFLITAVILSLAAGTATLVYKVKRRRSLYKVSRQYCSKKF